MDDLSSAKTVSPMTDVQQRLMTAALAALGSDGTNRPDEATRSFLAQAAQDFEPGEAVDISPEALGQAIADQWTKAAVRLDSKPAMTIAPMDATHAVIGISQPDAPFIVESIMGELADAGVSIRAMFHPVVTVRRDDNGARVTSGGEESRESYMLIVTGTEAITREDQLREGIMDTLHDLRLAVLDFPRMRKLLAQEIAALEALGATEAVDAATLSENLAFLRWIDANHFVFLGAKGYTYPRTADGAYAAEAPLSPLQEGYGVLRDTTRTVLRRSSEPAVLNEQMLTQLMQSEPVTVAKANIKSRVHRRAYMDYIGIKRYGPDGLALGEIRFVGLFTSEAYDRPAFEVPLVRRKAAHVLSEGRALGLSDSAYNEKRLRNIIETYPRDELFQMSADELFRISRGILHIVDRPRVRLFARRDPFDRFISILFYMPRELYQVSIQQKAGQALASAYAGRVSACYPYISDAGLSRIHYIIGVTPGDHFDPDIADLESDIEALTQSWPQKVVALAADYIPEAARVVPIDGIDWMGWARAFTIGYQDRFDLSEAVIDSARLNDLSETRPVGVRAYQRLEDPASGFCFKFYTRSEKAVPLSDILPVLENMGLKVLEEYSFSVASPSLGSHWIHEFIVSLPPAASDFAVFRTTFEDAVLAVWSGRAESDGLNALVLQGHDWRRVTLLRALLRYRVQSGMDPTADVQHTAMRDNPAVVNALLNLFDTRFAPGETDNEERARRAQDIRTEIDTLLRAVPSLDHDRTLRRLAALVGAILRTNYYANRPVISFKVASRDLKDLPEPRPYREIFVLAPEVEGVHLRFGPVARGGLRWSDRKDDYRTEVLGLVKAQQVKNAVIVPNGSKGGFYPKALPKGGTREEIQAEAIRAYKAYLSGLLDLTDTIDPDGKVIHPEGLVIWDDPDPYLVVAADKGTATFSDIANGVAKDYGFWLGDAFASGGSAGYDHKALGITARGAWEAVKRHFREMGRDIQTTPFTVAGVGDMSGDVFGNGMLLSPHTKLVAAFDHRDIFIDPNPDTEASFAERARLFALPRSSWADYDKSLISRGGGVFSRSLKSVTLTPEIKSLLDLEADEATPAELMQAVLKARVDLLWFGGIGTYIKSPTQTDLDVGDKANDAIRIDSTEVRAQVIGEGANLGVTQPGRIACAELGIRLNSDAIDNSAGVDCSDHEVNIKIALNARLQRGEMTLESRDVLLKDMTDDVAELVLADNYNQTLALSRQQATAFEDNTATQALMSALEKRGLDRRVENLPTNIALEARKAKSQGLFRPELAVVMAYAKIALREDIVSSDAPDDAAFVPTLTEYFPKAMHGMTETLEKHRLRREIISTVLANEIVNMAGPGFVIRMARGTSLTTAEIVRAFEATRRLFGLNALWNRVGELDTKVPAEAQHALYDGIAAFARSQAAWLAQRWHGRQASLRDMTAPYRDGLRALLKAGPDILTDADRARFSDRIQAYTAAGAPEDMARAVAALGFFHPALDIIDLSLEFSKDVARTGELYFMAGEHFGFDKLIEGAGELKSADPWDRLAVRRLIADVAAEHKLVVRAMMSRMKVEESPHEIIQTWQDTHRTLIEPLSAMVSAMTGAPAPGSAGAGWSFAKLSLVNAQLREWATRV